MLRRALHVVGPFLGRLLLLALLATFLHLLLAWLWNPRVAVLPPARAASKPPDATRPPGPEATILFGGDTAPTDAALPLIKEQGWEYPLSATVDLLQGADLTVLNLEAPVTDRPRPLPLYKTYSYHVAPPALAALRWAGVDAVSLANNHTADHGDPGLRDTLDHLRRAGIVALGAGVDAAAARRGVVFDVRGVRVGLLAYLEDSFMDALYTRSFALGDHAGCARLEAGALRDDLARLRRAADVVIVVAHWGRNYAGVTLLQRLYGRLLVDYGADAVIGHHPHVHHPVALYRGRPILYSLGNYAFGTPGREELRHGLLARLVLDVGRRRLRRVELIPLAVQNDQVQYKPERLLGGEAREMLQQLARDSAPHGARIIVAGEQGVLQL